MLNRFLPARADNTYRGYKIGLWIFGVVVLFRLLIAIGAIFNGHNAASQADGIPIATYGPAGAQTVVAEYALWGLEQVVISAVCIVVVMLIGLALTIIGPHRLLHGTAGEGARPS